MARCSAVAFLVAFAGLTPPALAVDPPAVSPAGTPVQPGAAATSRA